VSDAIKWEATTQDKELIGKLQVACSISTDPANKLSLTSSLITKVNAVMESKCKFYAPPSMDALYGEVLLAMLGSINDKLNPDVVSKTREKIDTLFKDTRKMPYESTNCIRDVYLITSCSNRWKQANTVYNTDTNSWSVSNAMLHDIFMVVDSIIRRNDLSSIPKSVSFSTTDLNIFANKNNYPKKDP
jgi:hypothetical protein